MSAEHCPTASRPAGEQIMSAARSATELVTNAMGRRVPTMVNGREQMPFDGIEGQTPSGNKAGPPIRSNSDYPANGDKRVPDLETALRLCGLRDGMTISSHHHLRNGDRVALTALADRRAHGRQRPGLVSQRIVSLSRAGDRPDEIRRGASHRRQHERPARRLLFARHTCAAWACCARTADAGRRCRMAKFTSTSR